MLNRVICALTVALACGCLPAEDAITSPVFETEYVSPTNTLEPTQPFVLETPTPSEQTKTPSPTPSPTGTLCGPPEAYDCNGSGDFPGGDWRIAAAGLYRLGDGLSWNPTMIVQGDPTGGFGGVFSIDVWAERQDYVDGEPPACTVEAGVSALLLPVEPSCRDCVRTYRVQGIPPAEYPSKCPSDVTHLDSWLLSLPQIPLGYRPCLGVCEGGPRSQALFNDSPSGNILWFPTML